MIAVLRSELYRSLTMRSSWVSMAGFAAVAAVFGILSADMWSLMTGFGAFGVAVLSTSQHYQHRTSVLLFLGQPRRLRVLAGQCLASVLIALSVAGVSGLIVSRTGEGSTVGSTLAVVPLMALFGVANATVIRRPTWLLLGWAGWFIFVEGLIGKLKDPWPFSAYLAASSGDGRMLEYFAGWVVLALAVAAYAIRRDLNGD